MSISFNLSRQSTSQSSGSDKSIVSNRFLKRARNDGNEASTSTSTSSLSSFDAKDSRLNSEQDSFIESAIRPSKRHNSSGSLSTSTESSMISLKELEVPKSPQDLLSNAFIRATFEKRVFTPENRVEYATKFANEHFLKLQLNTPKAQDEFEKISQSPLLLEKTQEHLTKYARSVIEKILNNIKNKAS